MSIYSTIVPRINDFEETPRFCKVKISAVVYEDDARKLGFVEPTHHSGKPYKILGRHIGENRMDFAVVLKKESDMPF